VGRRDDGFTKQTDRVLVPDALARTAANYQHHRLELDALRRQRLASLRVSGEPTLNPRRGAAALSLIHESRVARDEFREEVRHLVHYLQSTGEPMRRILDHVQGVLNTLRAAGVLREDGGAMAYELAHWIIEDMTTGSPEPLRSGARRRETRVIPLSSRAHHRPM
jgi:hypothetical protein